MTTNFTNTIEISTCNALCIDKATKQPVNVSIVLPYAVDADTATKPVQKALASRNDIAFAMVTAVTVKTCLCTLPIDIFTTHAVKLARRGEQGRTREPVMTRTLESSTCNALCIDKATKQPVNVSIVLPYAVDADTATKPVQKALASRNDIAFAMVTAVTVETAVYEMPVAKYIELCHQYGEIEAKNA